MERLYKLFYRHFGAEPDSVVPICGSGSNRRYCRMSSGDSVCMGVIGTEKEENNAFVTLARHFRLKGIDVPEVYAVSDDGMAYIQEDLGDRLLSDEVAAAGKQGGIAPDSPLVDLLCRTMAELPKIQFEGAEGLDFSVCYPQPAFDRRMVMFDLNYFKYCFLKATGTEFNEVLLQEDFESFADDLLSCDMTAFLYRDFNARNVMIRNGRPYFIDFQGGRRGPVYYDVASFVWQARAEYPDELKEKMLDAYLTALEAYTAVDRTEFTRNLSLFILFRLLQVLGAYGFRGWTEHKARFVVSIPPAMESLRRLLSQDFGRYPYLEEVLSRMVALPRFAPRHREDGRLEVTVYSFSYKKGIPHDPSGNGGGYVFDCRSIHNPGRYEPYRKLTGMDEAVIGFLEDDGEIQGFMEHVYGVVDPHVGTYVRRGFTDLTVSFGCTGGQHRSVYCAEHLAEHLASKWPDIRVRLIHREQGVDRYLTY
ncbi:MAG: phosphotransferase [Bacteroidales bacterium]|nr:phosphotransferase [Bacteroidales bacterium]